MPCGKPTAYFGFKLRLAYRNTLSPAELGAPARAHRQELKMPQAFSTPELHSPACRSLTFDADGFLSAINRNPADRGGWVGGVVLRPVKRYEHLTGPCSTSTQLRLRLRCGPNSGHPAGTYPNQDSRGQANRQYSRRRHTGEESDCRQHRGFEHRYR